MHRGYCHRKLECFKESIDDYSRVIEITGNLRKNQLNVGVVGTQTEAGSTSPVPGSGGLESLNNSIIDGSMLDIDNPSATASSTSALSQDTQLIESTYIKAYNHRAFSYARINCYEEAIEDYNVVLQHDPKNANAYHNRGISYDKIGKFDLAIADFSKVLELDSSQVDRENPANTSFERF